MRGWQQMADHRHQCKNRHWQHMLPCVNLHIMPHPVAVSGHIGVNNRLYPFTTVVPLLVWASDKQAWPSGPCCNHLAPAMGRVGRVSQLHAGPKTADGPCSITTIMVYRCVPQAECHQHRIIGCFQRGRRTYCHRLGHAAAIAFGSIRVITHRTSCGLRTHLLVAAT